MFLIIVSCVIVVAAFSVAGWIVYSARKEDEKAQEEVVVPVADLSSFEKGAVASSSKDVVLEGQSQVGGGAPGGAIKANSLESVILFPEKISVEGGAEGGGLSGEVAGKNEELVRVLKEEVKLIREKAVVQAKNAIEVINKLREQVEQLRAENAKLCADKAAGSGNQALLREYEAEKVVLNEKLHGALHDLEVLRDEMNKQAAAHAKSEELLKAEMLSLRQAAGNGEDVARLVQAVRDDYQARIDEMAARIETLKRGQGGVSTEGAGGAGQEELVVLQKAADVLRGDRHRLEGALKDSEARCALQIEKNNLLQYELTKSRAQSMGLERIYEYSRKQIEDLTRQVNDTRLNDKDLKKQADIWQKSLEEIKKINIELLRREKLSQFEIEKSRGDIKDLERIYDGFRSRLEKVEVSGGDV